jgi:hypothetical protein
MSASQPPARQPAGLGHRLLFTAVIGCLPLAVVALVEGSASLVFFARALVSEGRPLAERRHTEPDTLLGWINLPRVALSDQYGRGIGLHTNGQRFRHLGDLAPRPPAGQRRVVCSGDSFTLGHGVDDAHTWCALLDPDSRLLETVNMGQGGYGIDQAYLWYVRDGPPLHADVHLFAYISADFTRMQHSRFQGYPKPQLVRLDGGGVRAIGVPVPHPGIGPWMATVARAVQTLRSFQVIEWLTRHLDPAREYARDSMTWEVADAALADLARRDRAAGTVFVVVYLPNPTDFQGRFSERWRRWARAAAERGDFRYLDLIEPFRRLPADSVEQLFQADNGHYTAAGNAWVAEQLRRLVPELRTDAGP